MLFHRSLYNQFFLHYNYNNKINKNILKWIRINDKISSAISRKYFLLKCRRCKIFPKFIQNKIKGIQLQHNEQRNFQQVINKLQYKVMIKLLNLEIRVCINTLNNLIRQVQFINNFLQHNLLTNDFNIIKTTQIQYNKVMLDKHKSKLTKKFNDIINNNNNLCDPEIIFNEEYIINLTNIIIPLDVQTLLSFGPKFSNPTTLNKFPLFNILADIENILEMEVNQNQKMKNRTDISTIINDFIKKPIKRTTYDNFLIKAERNLKYLVKNNSDIIILQSDKTKKTVIMNKLEYQQKMNNLLSDTNTYELINKDPTTSTNNNLLKLLNTINISNTKIKKIIIKNPTCPRMYGLPKTHKPDIPLRPIVSTIDSPGYLVSKYLCKTLNHLTNNSKYNIKNSHELKSFLRTIQLNNEDILVSFDVTSLFTNIPTTVAINEIKRNWEQIKYDTELDKDSFIKILKFIINENNYFKIENRFYRQKFGLAMGNPLSPILADIVMEKLFEKTIKKLIRPPTFIKKYVDDIIMAIPRDCIEVTKEAFESFDERIKFTIETEINQEIPYLDLKLIRTATNRIKTNWYKKSTSSERLLNFLSAHPKNMKINVAQAFVVRVLTLSDKEYWNNNTQIIKNILYKNNYPDNVTKRIIIKAKHIAQQSLLETNAFQNNENPTHNNNNEFNTNNNDNNNNLINTNHNNYNININNNNNNLIQNSVDTKFVALTYIPGVTGKLTKILKDESNSFKVRIGNKVPNKLYHQFSKLKDKIPTQQRTNVVYEVACQCGKTYVGQTSQTLKQRLQKHKSEVRLKNKSSALSTHAIENNHIFDFDKARIIHHEKWEKSRLILESAHISVDPNKNVNYKTDTANICREYKGIIQKFKNKTQKQSSSTV